MRLSDQSAVVTGGSRGIGRAIARAFAAEGAGVAVVYRGSREAADALVEEIERAGGKAMALQADVTDAAAARACIERVQEEWGGVDILVNSAGIISDGLFINADAADWNRVLETNLGGTFNFCRAVGYMMLKRGRGRIINLSSVAADYVNLGQTNYAASKGAINAFTRALAVELAGRNVTVNAIAPGFIETDMSAAVCSKAGSQIKASIPMRRIGRPEDVARVATFLASEDSAYITGQVLTVDGGLSLGALPIVRLLQ